MSHPSTETLAAYWLGELPAEEEVELETHLFECEVCTDRSARMAALPRAIAFAVPPVVQPADANRLQRLDVRVQRAVVGPGGRAVVDFSGGAEAQLVVFQSDLHRPARVDVTLCARDGTPLIRSEDVPFDLENGTITIACRAHYLGAGGIPLEVSVQVEATEDGQRRSLGTFDIDHILPA